MVSGSSYILIRAVAILLFIGVQPCAFGENRVFRGKIIDFDTRRPLEGAVVVAMWFNPTRYLDIKDVKEALADKNGEWSIVVEGGSSYRLHPLPPPMPLMSDLVVKHIRDLRFMIFKPGYEDFQEVTGRSYSFLAYPHVDRKRGLEGIILSNSQKEESYIRGLSGKSHRGAETPYGVPFIPMKDAERRLRALEIPFDYPDNVDRLYVDVTDPLMLGALEDSLKTSDPEDDEDMRLDQETLQGEGFRLFANLFHFTGFLNHYTLFGLKRIEDKKDRWRVLGRVRPEPIHSDDPRQKELLSKQKHLLRLFEEECIYIGIDDYKLYRNILEY
jgi:hypothetical protein